MKTVKILHITAHLGGGIGSAYTGITRQPEGFENYKHTIICLEPAEKPIYIERVRQNDCEILICPSTKDLEKLLNQADIVHLNWWHHPLMAEFLYNFPDVPVRSALWIHVSGCTYPYLRSAFLEKFDKVFFPTYYSYENQEVSQWNNNSDKNKSTVIYGMGDASKYFSVIPKVHKGFRIGYMGTLDFNKLNPDFVRFCVEASKAADDITFVMIGDTSTKEEILRRAAKYGIENKFEFRGFCENISDELAQLDCMGYLLNPYHFGASENVILETMAAGVPVIMLNQNTEKYFVTNNINGFLINDENEYRGIIKFLYDNPEERKQIAKNARARIAEEYSTDKNNLKLYNMYADMPGENKRILSFKDIFEKEPSDWFLYFIQNEREMFLNNNLENIPEIFKGKNKSSVSHFLKYFPADKHLMEWGKRINQG